VAGVVGLVLAVPLLYGNGLLFGMHGQIQPSAYPTGWYAADRALAVDPHPGRTVFLPWNGYLSLSFVRNANRVLPALHRCSFQCRCWQVRTWKFLEYHVLTTRTRLLCPISLLQGRAGIGLRSLQRATSSTCSSRAKVGWTDYGYLDSQPGLQLVGDYGSILLYRNVLWQ